MRIAFLADIHGNLEALRACLASASERKAERLVFLGDIVGYGADPVACVELVQEHCRSGAAALMGNHDESIGGSRFKMNEVAAAAIEWTRAVLGAGHKAFLAALPLTIEDGSRFYVHSSARAAGEFPFVNSLADASESLMATPAHITVAGHVHAPALYNISSVGKVAGFIPVKEIPIPLMSQRRWLAVMGAVGQPRDGNPAAAYGLLDTSTNDLTFVRVAYDIERAAAKIRAAGLPEFLWKRLSVGR